MVVSLAIPIAHAGEADAARAATSLGDFNTALTRLDAAIKQNPDDAELWFVKADTLHKAGQIDEAIETYQVLIEKYPEVPEAYNNLAILYADQGDYPKAASTLQQVFQTRPEYATAFENLMSIYDKMASDAYRKALDAPASETKVELVVQDFNRDNGDITADNATPADSEQPVSSVTDDGFATTVTLASVERPSSPGQAVNSQPGGNSSTSASDPCSGETAKVETENSTMVEAEAADYDQEMSQNAGGWEQKAC